MPSVIFGGVADDCLDEVASKAYSALRACVFSKVELLAALYS